MRCVPLAAVAAAALAGSAWAQPPVDHVPSATTPDERRAVSPVVALLDAANSDRVALLEAMLGAEPGMSLVERGAIDAVLDEQALQAVFGPQGVGERVKIGAVFKADVLVLVRPAKDALEPVLEVVVGETAGGLRLLRRAVALGTDAAAGADALRAVVRDGLRKLREPITQIVAVPPFVGRDIGFETDVFQAAFARIAEAAADRPGVVAVELAEAEAIATELRIAAPGSRVVRPLPTYLLGEFRHEGTGGGRTVRLSLRAERGGQPVGQPVDESVAADKAAGVIQAWATAATGVPAAAVAGEALGGEARQLADRANDFHRLGEWEEALALAEASLLLNPDQPDMHALILKSLCRPLGLAMSRGCEPGNAERYERLYLRGLPHLEALFQSGHVDRYRDVAGGCLVMDFRGSANHLGGFTGYPSADDLSHLENARAADRAMAMRMLPVVARRNDPDAFLIADWAVQNLPPPERVERLGDIVLSLADLPDAAHRTVEIVRRGHVSPPDADTPAFATLLERLRKSGHKELRDAAAQLAALVTAAKAATLTTSGTSRPPTVVPEGVAFTPLEMRIDPPLPDARPGGKIMLTGVIQAGAGTDVWWSGRRGDVGLYLMRDKGVLRPVWRGDSKDGAPGFSTVSFDGRYVWATLLRHARAPCLLVLDPQTGHVTDLSAVTGLPQPPREEVAAEFAVPALAAAPIAPGKACVVGGVFGRSWVAIVAFDGQDGTARVFHEAREAANRTDTEQWRSTTVAFTPVFACVVGDGAASGRRILVGRDGGENIAVGDHPLVIDPDRLTVDVVKERVSAWPKQLACAVTPEAILFLEPRSRDGTPVSHLIRIASPLAAKEEIATGLPCSDGCKACPLLFHDGRIHMIIGQSSLQPATDADAAQGQTTRVLVDQWWSADVEGKGMRREGTGLRPVWFLGSSCHYGLVAFLDDFASYSGVPHAVSFTATGED